MLRVGSVPYLVGRPLDDGLGDEPGIELVQDVPARLVAGLRDGSIDVALVSSIELFRRPGYSYLDHLAVSGRGTVSSVQVFLRRPPAPGHRIALDPASRTAAALLRVVWPEPEPRFIELEEPADPRAVEADAWLRIGDEALRELHEPGALPVFNPSEAWTERTGLPFVFAPWIVGPRVDPSPYLPAFERARARGAARTAELACEAAAALGLPEPETRYYLETECLFEPGPELTPALLAFRDAAAALGLARRDLEPQPVPGIGAGQAR